MRRRWLSIWPIFLNFTACATTAAPLPSVAPPTAPAAAPSNEPPRGPRIDLAAETHLRDLRQLTALGENAEAYWRFDGKGLSMQRRSEGMGCDRIYTLALQDSSGWVAKPEPVQVSSGKGATTCAHFFPGDRDLLYASTQLGGDACPPKPDMSQGYVWALYDSYDIFKANADGSNVRRMTDNPGYDAEGTVCAKDGSIVFTSVRDGDLELYRMDKDGGNVKRLTSEPGYDGGAFFNADCSKIVWRASRPKLGPELDAYKALLARGLVRPTKLELFVANSDGSEARQVTYLNAAAFAPFWFPNRERILFSSNYGDPKGREFDIFAIDADGTNLERVTHSPGFDGFPMFSPDGKWLAFSSNRLARPDSHDTNLFLARWDDHAPRGVIAGAAERIQADATWLADPAREGRGVGTAGLEAAGVWLEKRFAQLGLEPLGVNQSYRVPFDVTTALAIGPTTKLAIAGSAAAAGSFIPLGFSGHGSVAAAAVLAGHGIQDRTLGIDDYRGLDVKGKIVIVRRFAPEHPKLQTPAEQRRAGDLRKKAFVARSLGAKGLIVVDWPAQEEGPSEAALPPLQPEGTGDAGLPVLVATRAALAPIWPQLERKQRVDLELAVALEAQRTPAFNVVGRLAAKKKTQGPIVIGAHYDHLGFGGHGSLAPDKHTPHLGADDNASGTASLLEIARLLVSERDRLTRDVVFAAFSGEELGILGSSALIDSKPAWLNGATAMLNLDMVGRLRMNTLNVLGSDSAKEWNAVVQAACDQQQVRCKLGGDGYGPSDHLPFYTRGLPVLHFFTGAHSDYHKPSDVPALLNAGGMAEVAKIVAQVAKTTPKLTYQKSAAPAERGDARSFNASLGTVPDYAGPPPGVAGVLLSDVRPGGGAERAGMRRGDVLTKLGKLEVRSVEDLMFVLMQAKPGETVTAVVLRDGRELKLETTYQEGRRR